jgi:hypothetical protein
MKLIPLGFIALLLTACGTIDPKSLENSLVISANCAEVFTLSKYKWFGIGTQLRDADATIISNAICKKSP